MERLQKILAQAGIASRRKCEQLILEKRVQVNGKTVSKLGSKADPLEDEITVDGKPIRKENHVYLLLHKPKGVITSVSDPKGRKTVTDFLSGVRQRVYPVGRLDYDIEGLLLLTNDGDFSNRLMHPRYHIPKTYHITVRGTVHGSALDKLRSGVELEDGRTAPAEAEYIDIVPEKGLTILTMTIHEGRNRQIRRMIEQVHGEVLKLRRVALGFLTLEGVSRGKFRHLTRAEVKELMDLADRPPGS